MKRGWSRGALEVVELVDNVGYLPAPTGHVPCCLRVSASEQRVELIKPAT